MIIVTTICLLLLSPAPFPAVSLTANDRPVIKSIANSAAERSRLPSLHTGADGELYLSWVEPAGDGATRMRFSTLGADRWSTPRTIAEGSDWFVNWADFPSLAALSDGTLAAHWLGRLGAGSYSYGVRMSISRDHGESWGGPFTPHRDRSATEHGFVSMVPLDAKRFRVVWLDGQAMAQGSHEAEELDPHPHGHGGMSIRTATIDRKGKVTGERVIDDRTCECCQTTAAVLGGEVIVAWRDRSETEVRDISIARIRGDEISAPRTIHDDGWNQEGCPVNGPALAVSGEQLAAVWYTEAKARPQVLWAHSSDRGDSFSKPITIDDGNPVGRVDLAPHPDRGWIACWLERGDDGGEIRVRVIGIDGKAQPSLLIARTSTERAAGFPQIEVFGKRVIIAWTETTAGESVSPVRVRTAELAYPVEEEPKSGNSP